MRKCRADYDAAIAAFVQAFPVLQRAASRELNGMYNAADYPVDIRARFGHELNIMPLPDTTDFRVQLAEGDLKDIREGLERETQRTLARAMRDPFERLYKHITRMVERLDTQPKGSKGRFHDSLVDGLVDLCEVLPSLNLTNDPQLENWRRSAEKMIAGIDAQKLRDVPAIRRSVAKQATEIQTAMAAFMGNSGVDDDEDDAEGDEA
jgi:hypothetical protein